MKITIELNKKSIQKAIKDIKKYSSTIDEKINRFMKELASIGIDTATITYQRGFIIDQADIPQVETTPIWIGEHELVVRAHGESIAFVEFGSGIHFNTPVGTSPHPLGGELGMTIGSYGKGQGAKDFWYYNKNGQGVRTYGQPSVPAMYEASKAMRLAIEEKAKEIFYSD